MTLDLTMLDKEAEADNRGLFGFIGDSEDVPITVDFVNTLIREFVSEVILARTQWAKGESNGDEYAATINELAARDEQILYGNVAGFHATSHWDENGLGRDLAVKVNESDPSGQVSRRLVTLALAIGTLYDRAAVDVNYDWRLDMDTLTEALVREFTGVPESYTDGS
jgi:hypothetical protein